MRNEEEVVNLSSVLQRAKDRAVIVPFVFRVFPAVERELHFWRLRAEAIPDPELRRQALASLDKKRFHCQGGSIFSLLTPQKAPEMVRFIVAMQTISDYLDNLCDRVGGADEKAYRTLHQAMTAAVDTDAGLTDWYADYPHRDDGGYLDLLTFVSRSAISAFSGYGDIRRDVLHLTSLYCDLQVYKHMDPRRRMEMLVRWHTKHSELAPDILWWEFAAAAGSTLGVFALTALAAGGGVSRESADELLRCYFPWVCGLHILLDYYIDLDEDREHGDFNFVACYTGMSTVEDRLGTFVQKALDVVEALPRPAFHRTVIMGLLSLYLSDPKALTTGRRKISQHLLRYGGPEAQSLHSVCKMLRKRGII